MMLTFAKERHGKLVVITGPVFSEKTTTLEMELESAADRIWSPGDPKILLFTHPNEDPENPGHIGKFQAITTSSVYQIAASIRPETKAILIDGVNFYTNPKIEALLQQLVLSNRKVWVTGLNLDSNGNPYNFMPRIMALADEFYLLKSACRPPCSIPGTRSQLIPGEYRWEARCIDHFDFLGKPKKAPHLVDQVGSLELRVGGMFSKKSKGWNRRRERNARQGNQLMTFAWTEAQKRKYPDKDFRPFTMGEVDFHETNITIPAILIDSGNDIITCLERATDNPDINNRSEDPTHLFIDEGSLIPNLFPAVNRLIYQGYNISITGLMRDYRMLPFGDMPYLLTIADTIKVNTAYCTVCGIVATDSQRLVDGQPVPYDDPTIAVGGSGKYQARCKDHVMIPHAPPKLFDIPDMIG